MQTEVVNMKSASLDHIHLHKFSLSVSLDKLSRICELVASVCIPTWMALNHSDLSLQSSSWDPLGTPVVGTSGPIARAAGQVCVDVPVYVHVCPQIIYVYVCQCLLGVRLCAFVCVGAC